ncbi:Nicastrin [Zea mays]|uniref:Nicastrin n=1 Tax=Zea mays TaxID=4577 RepID=A0A1D6P084_MAIZE|nr:Nicastrin [Zea mays]
MAMEPSVDAKNTENNSSEFAVNGHLDQNDSSDSALSNIDDGDNSEDEDGSTNTISSYHVNDFQRLVLACDDGSVRLYNVPESGALTYYRSLPRVSGDGATLESVPDLVKAMYLNVESFPCVRLLNLSGEIGCSRYPMIQNFTRVAGALVESNGVNNDLQELSPDRKFTQDDFAPYSNHNHDWNPAGSEKNEKTGNGYKSIVAEFDLVMQGSVWTSLPPLKNGSTEHLKPLILAIASQDSASFFWDRSLGSDSPISGLIALLTAVDALSHIHGLSKLKKQLVFAVFNGEAWGYLGSRKFLQELDEGAASVNGISSLMIDQALEIGSIGKAILEEYPSFYVHVEGVRIFGSAL